MGLWLAARSSHGALHRVCRGSWAWQAAGRTARPPLTVDEPARMLGAAAAAAPACGYSSIGPSAFQSEKNAFLYYTGETVPRRPQIPSGNSLTLEGLVPFMFGGAPRCHVWGHEIEMCAGQAGRSHLPRPAAARGGRAAARAGRGHGGRARRAAGAAVPRGGARPVRRRRGAAPRDRVRGARVDRPGHARGLAPGHAVKRMPGNVASAYAPASHARTASASSNVVDM